MAKVTCDAWVPSVTCSAESWQLQAHYMHTSTCIHGYLCYAVLTMSACRSFTQVTGAPPAGELNKMLSVAAAVVLAASSLPAALGQGQGRHLTTWGSWKVSHSSMSYASVTSHAARCQV